VNLIDSLKLNLQYSSFKSLNIDENLLKQIINDKEFTEVYKKNKTMIDSFLKSLKEYRYVSYDSGSREETPLTDEMINYHLKSLLEHSKTNSQNNYISFITNREYHKFKIDNQQAFKDKNFQQLYSLLGTDIFNENIARIIENGYSDRLIEFMENPNLGLTPQELIPDIFSDKVWNAICQNENIGNKKLLDIFNNKHQLIMLSEIINKDLYDGLKTTYEQVPESQSFIENMGGLYRDAISVEQFSMDFVNNLGTDNLKKLYARRKFREKQEFDAIFKMAEEGNYQLIEDIINFDYLNINFSRYQNVKGSFIEVDTDYSKKDIFLNNYLGISSNDLGYVRIFLESINLVEELPLDFQNKYGELQQLLNSVSSMTDEELIQLSKNFSSKKRDEYGKLIKSFEKDGNQVLRNQFSVDLKSKNNKILANVPHTLRQFNTSSNEKVDINVFELTGEPFTMLVHAITDNRMSVHNNYVKEIVGDPSKWENIQSGNNHISTSLISNEYMTTYGTSKNADTVMYGFDEISADMIAFTQTQDVGINRKASASINVNMRDMINLNPSTNTVTTVDNLMQKTIRDNKEKEKSSRMWNEIGLLRVDPKTGKKIRPNYIVCMDTIHQASIDAANYFNIPIYLIHTNLYPEFGKNNEIEEQKQNLVEQKKDLRRKAWQEKSSQVAISSTLDLDGLLQEQQLNEEQRKQLESLEHSNNRVL